MFNKLNYHFLVELEQMLQRDGVALNDISESTFMYPWLPIENSEAYPNITGHIGSGSGGYADHLFIYAAKELFGINIYNIEYKNLRFNIFKFDKC